MELAFGTKEWGYEVMVKNSGVVFVKLPAQKMQGIPIWHPNEERDDVITEEDVVWFPVCG